VKLIALTTALSAVASSAFAGAVAYVAPVEMEMITEEAGSMGGSGAWLIPLIAIALIFLVMKGGEEKGGELVCETGCYTQY